MALNMTHYLWTSILGCNVCNDDCDSSNDEFSDL
jgi:hypothetical protein